MRIVFLDKGFNIYGFDVRIKPHFGFRRNISFNEAGFYKYSDIKDVTLKNSSVEIVLNLQEGKVIFNATDINKLEAILITKSVKYNKKVAN